MKTLVSQTQKACLGALQFQNNSSTQITPLHQLHTTLLKLFILFECSLAPLHLLTPFTSTPPLGPAAAATHLWRIRLHEHHPRNNSRELTHSLAQNRRAVRGGAEWRWGGLEWWRRAFATTEVGVGEAGASAEELGEGGVGVYVPLAELHALAIDRKDHHRR
jgi:hypothetical protein